MKIAIASDHGGYQLKNTIVQHLTEKGIDMTDFGTKDETSVDYPDYAKKVGVEVASKKYDLGILVCGTGIGMSIAANKVPGIRCALVSDCFSARATRQHNDSNILALGGRVIGTELALEIVDIWLKTEFEAGRHQRRVDQIADIEKKHL
ncbi:ribose 5-phosphate isomerase B [Tindallia californiensis]|uniref:Ribose 5-phosphate isomerase B n=1 Tax=Tindallia californiensis TaxID=159292 RepID=A0A1H3LGQ9_9FIRM|nr:ribose 5-phosphate isomerase B [Tindallia californiensis]SDY63717.1 ribose 5-phosphate isomerase B [Tindallia californiensis]